MCSAPRSSDRGSPGCGSSGNDGLRADDTSTSRCVGARKRRGAMKVFVTGASGVIGRLAIPILRRDGHTVTAAAHSEESRTRLASLGIDTVAISLFDPDALSRAVEGQDLVINLATHIPDSSLQMFLPGAWRENDRIRRDGSA